MRMFREARPAPTVHADARPGRPRYTAPHEAHGGDAAQDDGDGEHRTGYAVRGRALALSRLRAQAKAATIRATVGTARRSAIRQRRRKGIPRTPCQKGQPPVFHFPQAEPFSFPRETAAADSGRSAIRRRRRPARPPQSRHRPGCFAERRGATLIRRPGRRSCFPIPTPTNTAPATPCAVGALALRAYAPERHTRKALRARVRASNVWKIGRGIFQSLETRHPAARARKTTAQDAPRLANAGRRGSSYPPTAALPATPMHGACTRLAESPPDPGDGFADSPRLVAAVRSAGDAQDGRPQSRHRPGFIAERRAALRSSAGPVAGPCSTIPTATNAAPATPCAVGALALRAHAPRRRTHAGEGGRAQVGGKGLPKIGRQTQRDAARRRETHADAAAHRPARLFR